MKTLPITVAQFRCRYTFKRFPGETFVRDIEAKETAPYNQEAQVLSALTKKVGGRPNLVSFDPLP